MTPSGIIMQSSSVGATPEAIEAVLTKNGYEVSKPEPEAPVAPERADFKDDEAFAAAQEEFEVTQEAAAAAEEEEEAPKPVVKASRKQRAIDKATRELKDELRATKERLTALEGGKQPAAAAPATIQAPQRDKFPSDAAFEEAMFDYRYQVRRAKEAAQKRWADKDGADKDTSTHRVLESFKSILNSVLNGIS